jgi:uncharacterized C2H2 Zn-finger protein
MRTILQRNDSGWTTTLYGCQYCTETFKTIKYCSKHEITCERLNTIKKTKEELNMPIQRIMKGGETFYRWGQSGKLYRKREDAEKQAAAAYASGYKKKED